MTFDIDSEHQFYLPKKNHFVWLRTPVSFHTIFVSNVAAVLNSFSENSSFRTYWKPAHSENKIARKCEKSPPYGMISSLRFSDENRRSVSLSNDDTGGKEKIKK